MRIQALPMASNTNVLPAPGGSLMKVAPESNKTVSIALSFWVGLRFWLPVVQVGFEIRELIARNGRCPTIGLCMQGGLIARLRVETNILRVLIYGEKFVVLGYRSSVLFLVD